MAQTDQAAVPRAPRTAALVLAAGASSRMGTNKLLADWRGKPIIRWTVEAALASRAVSVLVVTGFDADRVGQALAGLDVRFAHNPNYSMGLSTSLSTGLKAIGECDGAIVLLGDMPEIAAPLIDRMIAAFSPDDGRAVCVATRRGKRGNPVLWARRFFSDMERITGDNGAKHLIGANEDVVCEVEAGDDAVFADVDTRRLGRPTRAQPHMSDPLYAKDLLRLAAIATGAGRLAHPDAAGVAHNPICGDHVSVTIALDADGRITALAHETKACVLTQASAAILGAHLAGAAQTEVHALRKRVVEMLKSGAVPPSPFGDYAALAGAAEYRNRHTCVLLPIDAVLDALTPR